MTNGLLRFERVEAVLEAAAHFNRAEDYYSELE
jgi:hypothetical protein